MRIILAAAAGAAVVFLWGAISWAVLALPAEASGRLDGVAGERLAAAIGDEVEETGVYFVPVPPELPPDVSDADRNAAMEAFLERHRQGPLFMLVWLEEGAVPMAPAFLLNGLLISFVAALLVAAAMAAVGGGFGRRFAIALAMGTFAALVSHGVYWNWFMFPDAWTAAMAADLLVGWGLAGLVMAAIVRPRRPAAA
jgi:hypothetical protein